MKIKASNIHKAYGDVTALDGLSLEIPSGTTFGILGTNGAGKTTLFKLLVGHDTPDSGQLTVGEYDVADAGVEIREHVGYLPERIGFPGALTGREVLTFHARMRDLARDGRIDRALETVGLDQSAADRAVEGYSNGMRRRLGLAAAILPRPSVLVLDEPTAGLDPRGVAEFHDIVQRIRSQTDATVVVTSHVLPEIEQLCDRVAILKEGELQVAGRVSDLLTESRVTVQLRPADSAAISELEELSGPFGTVSIDGERLRVQCEPDEIPRLFGALDTGPELAGVNVERAGLETAFHEAIGSEVKA